MYFSLRLSLVKLHSTNQFNLHGDVNAAHTCVLEVAVLLCDIGKLQKGRYSESAS